MIVGRSRGGGDLFGCEYSFHIVYSVYMRSVFCECVIVGVCDSGRV